MKRSRLAGCLENLLSERCAQKSTSTIPPRNILVRVSTARMTSSFVANNIWIVFTFLSSIRSSESGAVSYTFGLSCTLLVVLPTCAVIPEFRGGLLSICNICRYHANHLSTRSLSHSGRISSCHFHSLQYPSTIRINLSPPAENIFFLFIVYFLSNNNTHKMLLPLLPFLMYIRPHCSSLVVFLLLIHHKTTSPCHIHAQTHIHHRHHHHLHHHHHLNHHHHDLRSFLAGRETISHQESPVSSHPQSTFKQR